MSNTSQPRPTPDDSVFCCACWRYATLTTVAVKAQVDSLRDRLEGKIRELEASNREMKEEYQREMLMSAASSGDECRVEELLSRTGVSVDFVLPSEPEGRTMLFRASQNGHRDVIDLLIENGANVNIGTSDGRTPLHIASQQGHVDIVDMLLIRGVDVDLCTTDELGASPLFLACVHDHSRVVELLLNYGADVNLATRLDGVTPLFAASMLGLVRVMNILIGKGADLEQSTTDGFTPLIFAAHRGEEAVVRMLLAAGAKIWETNENLWLSRAAIVAIKKEVDASRSCR